jgi:hypothetical protein
MGLNLTQPPTGEGIQIQGSLGRYGNGMTIFFRTAFIVIFDMQNSGPTGERPVENMYVGKPYFDVTLGLPIWYDGSQWIDATGAAA